MRSEEVRVLDSGREVLHFRMQLHVKKIQQARACPEHVTLTVCKTAS